MSTDPEADFERLISRVADELRERQRTAHERVACPKCHAPVGLPCRRALRPFTRAGIYAVGQPVLRNSHGERLAADGMPPR